MYKIGIKKTDVIREGIMRSTLHEENSFEDLVDDNCQIYKIFWDKFFLKFGKISS